MHGNYTIFYGNQLGIDITKITHTCIVFQRLVIVNITKDIVCVNNIPLSVSRLNWNLSVDAFSVQCQISNIAKQEVVHFTTMHRVLPL